MPVVAGVVAAHDVPVLLHEQRSGPGRVHGEVMHAVADLGCGRGMPSDSRPLLTGCQVTPRVIGAEDARRGDGDEDPVGVLGSSTMVCRHMPPAPGCHCGPEPCSRSPASSLPALAAVGRAEQRRVLDARVNGVALGRRRLQVPDAGELPRVRGAVVPLVRAGDALVVEVLADRLPALAAVVGALDELPEPAGGLRGVEPIRVDRRAGDVVDLPAREVRAADVPAPPGLVRGENEGALASADENPYRALRCCLCPPAPPS